MTTEAARGDYVGGRFLAGGGPALRSVDPATGALVFETPLAVDHVGAACEAAAEALPAWRGLGFDARLAHLHRFRDALGARREDIAEAIRLEVGKVSAEAAGETAALLSRFDLIEARIRTDLRDGPLPGHPQEALVHQPHGVVGVVGPFNFPLHLCHAHVVPALLLGNTVVLKPSEVAPLAAQRYAEAARAAGLPPGVLNVVQGRGAAGAALVDHPALRALAFTGSWNTGRRILGALIDRPEVLVALEMGGKNVSIVCEDADLRQAAHEIVVGGYLTTGQRCTCTDRVLVHRSLADPLTEAIGALVRGLRMGDPTDPSSFAGPLATAPGRDKLLAALDAARGAGVDETARGWASDAGPGFVAPTVHRLPDGVHHVPGYTDVELFGPDVGIEVFDDDDHALALLDRAEGGLAYAVFSADRRRFERFVGRVHTGILNWNRSTNQASPRLPFGGVGKAGNFRPAGAHAPRNLAIPVAVQSNQPGAFTPRPHLVPNLPAPDLDALDAAHAAEERDEAARRLVDTPRPLAPSLPPGGRVPASDAWLERLYAGGRIVREKKPGVFDHLRSQGPWFVSVDRDPPLSVRDGMSQTATLPAGFAPDDVVRAYVEGGFGDALVRAGDPAAVHPRDEDGGDGHPAAAAFADALRRAVPGLPHVTFVNGGAESCEKALALCHAQVADPATQGRVLAFEGSFHGRTLLALGASHNPAKRGPFEIAGYEVDFAPFPVWWAPQGGEPPTPEGLLELVARGALDQAQDRFGWSGDPRTDRYRDCLLAEEVASLVRVDAMLGRGETFAVVVEPMQSEGGDRYATARFFRCLRLLTRHHGVGLVVDEVQTGFGLGGPVAWHARFGLVDGAGQPDVPDAVTFAKRAQVGVVMSRFRDPEPTSSHPASLIRGRLHLAHVRETEPVARAIEDRVRVHLEKLAGAFPELVRFPRGSGYAAAFDLPSPAHLQAYLAQRFWRGAIVFGAGSRTVRYRLSSAWTLADVDALFEAVRGSLAWLAAAPGVTPPAWLDLPGFADGGGKDRNGGTLASEGATEGATDAGGGRETPSPREIRVRRIRPDEADTALASILALEERVYEPARRDPPARLRLALDDPDGLALVAETRPAETSDDGDWSFAGYALAAPIEALRDVEGIDRDPFLGRGDTIYSLALTVSPDRRGLGLGRRLKETQIREAAALRRADGGPRYRHLTARNRVGAADPMTRLARSLGAYAVFRLQGQYGEAGAEAIYYRLPLGPFAPAPRRNGATTGAEGTRRDWRGTLASPFETPPASLRNARDDGALFGPAATKITLCNYVTPAVVRALEGVGALAPAHPHLYLTSSRDETVDKTLRLLRVHRPGAQVALGLAGGYVGHTTAAARSLSDPAVHRGGPAYYRGFQRCPHPADVGVTTAIAALRDAIAEAGGPDRVLGLWVEPVQERTGRVLPDDFGAALAELAGGELGVPVVAVETATAGYRGGTGAFAYPELGLDPDVVTWWGGGQVGFLHVAPRWHVPKPLTLVSTWDGDELSLVRVHHQLRAARHLDRGALGAALDRLVERLPAGWTGRGRGALRVLRPDDSAGRGRALADALGRRGGWRLPVLWGGSLVVAPPLDVAPERVDELADAIAEAAR